MLSIRFFPDLNFLTDLMNMSREVSTSKLSLIHTLHLLESKADTGIIQPAWKELTSVMEAEKFADEVSYPVLVRPSYVL